MFNLKRGASFVATNPLSYVFAVLITFLCMTGVAFVANYTAGLYENFNAIRFDDGDNVVYFSGYYKASEFDETKLKGDYLKLQQYSSIFISDNSVFEYVAYDELLAENVNVRLKKGVWFTKAEKRDGEINAVIAKNDKYSAGDLITVSKNPSSVLRIRITGVLPENFSYVAFGRFSYPSDLSMLFERYSGDHSESDFFLIGEREAVEENKITSGCLYRFENLSANEMADNIAYLKSFANVASLSEMRDGNRQQIKTSLDAYIPTIVLSSLLCAASLAAISFITIGNNRKNLSVLYFCGARKKDIFAVILSYLATVFVPSAALFGIINAVVYDKLSDTSLIALPGVFLCVFAGVFLIMTCICIASALYADRNIIKTIKEE